MWLKLTLIHLMLVSTVHPCPDNCQTCLRSTCDSCKDGFYLGFYNDCSYPCPPNCKTCTSFEQCSVCKDGFYQGFNSGVYTNKCLETCPSNCIRCESFHKCSICKDGFYIGYAPSTRMNFTDCTLPCPQRCVSCLSLDMCQQCVPRFYGSYCNQSCPGNCNECTSFEHCIFCKIGKYGNVCSINCPANCKYRFCKKATGYCYACSDGYHGNMCEHECPAKCATCVSSDTCTSCQVGFTGPTCQKMCGHCKSGSGCRVADGVCDGGCENGYRGRTCLYNCSSVCATCSSSDSYCDTCVNGKYGKHPFMDHYICNLDCPVNCLDRSCDHDTGNCLACVDGYKGNKCDCPELCEACSSPGICSSCQTGYVNVEKNCECRNDICTTETCDTCSNSTWFADNATSVCCKCSRNCLNRECSSECRCLLGCVMGRYGEGCERLCSLHDQNCVECKSNGDVYAACTKCKEGFYPNTTGACISCHGTCVNNFCSSTNGHCIIGCLNLAWGDKCDNDCPKYCLMCDRKAGHCLKCQEGNHFIDCSDNCNNNCNTNEKILLLCTANSSRCVHICSDGCIEKKCDNNSGRCLLGCEDDYFGSTCSRACSDNCGDVRSGRRCSESNGTCTNGCKAGYYGAGCDERCSMHCVHGICYGPKRHCTFGCVDGYRGDICPRDTVDATEDSDNSDDLIGVALGTTGAAIAITAVLVIVFVLRRRRRLMLRACSLNK